MFSTDTAAPQSATDPILDKAVAQLNKLRTQRPDDYATLRPNDVDAWLREETGGKYGRQDALPFLTGQAPPVPFSGADQASLAALAPKMYAAASRLRAGGTDVTPAHLEEFVRTNSSGRFGLSDVQRAMLQQPSPAGADRDPSLINAARQLAAAKPKAIAAGEDITPEDQEAFIREETQGRYGLRDAARYLSTIDPNVTPRNMTRSFLQGALGNWGDEVLSKLPAWLGGGAASEADMRAREEAFARTHPVASGVGTLAGAGSAGLLIPGGAEANIGRAALRGATTGLVGGAAAGAGAGETSEQRKSGAVIGAATGGALGAAIPAAVGGASLLLRSPANRALARVARALEQSGGADKAKQAASDLAAAGRGDEMMLGDLSDYMRNATDFAATNDGDGSVSVPLAQRVRARQADASDRLLGDVRSGFGGDANANARRVSLESSREQWAAGPNGYGGLRDAGGSFDLAPLANSLKHPTIQSAMKQARLAGDLTSDSPLDQFIQRILAQNPDADPSAIASAAKAGLFGDDVAAAAGKNAGRPLTFDDVHQLKRTLDGRTSAAFQNGNGALGNSYATIRDAVNDALEQGVPGYKAVNAEYGQRLGLERALSAGEDAWGVQDSRALAQQVAGLSSGELAEFRTGLASKLISQLRGAATNRDEAARLLNASKAMRDKLQTVFGDQPTLDGFMRRVGGEAELAKIRGALGGSQTAKRLQSAGFDPAELGLDAVVHGPAGLVRSALNFAVQNTSGRVARSTAREMGPLLMTQGQADINALIDRVLGQNAIVASPWMTAAPAAAGRMPLLGR